ncbi:major facilitator superfamily domain-containing protein [Talaromyces proteolyticus]|uniref:Major facilitator superfamily domain-containing protein n=1 Tax=Talaromyces proteolyticus TaxID=1131652 RepID=A0AAD4KJE1_9EURO|nr:major facilitator superfamily domain-containing protein [Talaromyces proteolyticus]KAH8693840.1 major facilitator superfamily domain-containing protein [Talaromyces proteolyticus]
MATILESKTALSVVADTEREGKDADAFDLRLERRLVRKMDMYIIPVYMITYMFSFIDRVNIGNAKVAGLAHDLHLQGSEYNVAVSIFYVTYVIFEIPLTVLLKLVGPSRLSWSLITIFSGFLQNYTGFIIVRLLLGLCESAFFPSLNLYVSMFWKRDEIAKRAIALMVSMSLAGAFGGLLAYGLVQMDGIGGYAGWRWLYFIEGLISFVFAVACFWLLPDNPETAYFLTSEERELGKKRLISQGNYEEFSFQDVKAALKSPICWLSSVVQIAACVQVYSMSTFLPIIVNGLGYSSLQSQYLTIPVYITGALGVFAAGYIADYYQARAPILLSFSLPVIAGYATLLGTDNPAVNYFGCYLVVFGSYVYPGLNLTWLNGNTAPHYKRAAAVAMNQTIGNIGGIIAGQIYLARESPRYKTGHAVSLSGLSLAWVVTWILWAHLRRENGKKEQQIRDDVKDAGRGDTKLDFKYQL